MITFLKFGHHGRLGNILFQYAFLRSASLTSGQELILPDDINNREWHSQKCLLSSFNVSYTKENSKELLKKVKFTVEEKREHYYNFVEHYLKSIDGINYYGYFQNYLYFKKFEELILREFALKDELEQESLKMLSEIRRNYKGYNIVSLQMRRGDHLNNKPHNSLNLYASDGSLSENCRYKKYIDTCISKIEGKSVLILSTGGSREDKNQGDIEWCIDNFKDYNYLLTPASTDIQDFALMSKCDANIMGVSSTFGWWASFLNKESNLTFCPDLTPDFKKTKTFFKPEKFKEISI